MSRVSSTLEKNSRAMDEAAMVAADYIILARSSATTSSMEYAVASARANGEDIEYRATSPNSRSSLAPP